MILEHVAKCIDEVYNEVLESPSVEVQNWIQKLENDLNQEDMYTVMKKSILTTLTFMMSQGIFDDEFFESTWIQNIEFVVQHIPDMKKSMVLKVKLDELGDQIYRIIKVPYGIILADLSYLILASMNADGSHLFTVEMSERGRFGCDGCDQEFIDEYAADVTIPELNIQSGDCFDLNYDLGDNYLFEIEVLDIEDNESVQSIEDVEILDGAGYGIWEDQHALLDLYFDDRQSFFETIAEYGLTESDFVLEDFDVDTYNEMLIEDFEYLKTVYEMPESLEI